MILRLIQKKLNGNQVLFIFLKKLLFSNLQHKRTVKYDTLLTSPSPQYNQLPTQEHHRHIKIEYQEFVLGLFKHRYHQNREDFENFLFNIFIQQFMTIMTQEKGCVA